MERESQIVRASVVNIIGNIILAVAKGVVGTLSGSIAVTLDAVNSVSDSLSSIISIVGTKFAGKAADHDHPFGYGRIEYLTSVTVASIILAAGLSSLLEAVRSIMHPASPEYSVVIIVVVAVAALAKFALGLSLIREGKRLNSGSLKASGADAMLDGGVSLATCVAGILYLTTSLQLEAWLAAVIALLIIRSGVELLIETISKILGERVDPKMAEKVEQDVRSVDGVKLANGLVLLDFGPDRLAGSIYVTVDESMTVKEFDKIVRKVQARVYENQGVILCGVTPYADPAKHEDVHNTRAVVGQVVWANDEVVDLRGLYVEPEQAIVRLDAVVRFGADRDKTHAQLMEALGERLPGWTFELRVLPDIAD